mmetsp:Transcript_107604/g.195743  ORF Transcript_107604/g.195743 Transcript_107604/m.195743 type:complete len:332 (-) Transcript_107604:28-1023(-)
MESDLSKVQALFDKVFDPQGDRTLNSDSILRIFKDLDPQQQMWTRENIDHMVQVAAPGCKGCIRPRQLLSWAFSSHSPTSLESAGGKSRSEPSEKAKRHAQSSAVIDIGVEECDRGSQGKVQSKAECAKDLVKTREKAECSKVLVTTREKAQPANLVQAPVLSPVGLREPSKNAPGKAMSLAERRKVALGNMPVLSKADSGPASQAPLMKISAQVGEPTSAHLSNREQFRKHLIQSTLDEGPMTDTRHNMKAWGRSNTNSGSLFSRRKSADMTVATVKWADLGDVPKSPKDRIKVQNAFETIDEFGEESMVRLITEPCPGGETRNRRHSIG